jgi:KipI family sensor histidine kinase inhibitor
MVAGIRRSSDRSLTVSFGEQASEAARLAVLRSTPALAGLAGVVNLHPAYASVVVEFDPRRTAADALERALRDRLDALPHAGVEEARVVQIPVRYDGPDLADVARHTGLAADEVVRRHAAVLYTVCFLGFSPGFPYLSGLDPSLATPRLASPRPKVAAGSVAIGGAQTGVYPVASPGGWRIIGRTSLALFRPSLDPPVLLRMGDRVRFVAVEGV